MTGPRSHGSGGAGTWAFLTVATVIMSIKLVPKLDSDGNWRRQIERVPPATARVTFAGGVSRATLRAPPCGAGTEEHRSVGLCLWGPWGLPSIQHSPLTARPRSGSESRAQPESQPWLPPSVWVVLYCRFQVLPGGSGPPCQGQGLESALDQHPREPREGAVAVL